jgi:hypothetical protein
LCHSRFDLSAGKSQIMHAKVTPHLRLASIMAVSTIINIRDERDAHAWIPVSTVAKPSV